MKKITSMLLCASAAWLAYPGTLLAAETKVAHKPLGYFTPEKRIRVEAKVTDPKGVQLVRSYFKSDAHADYLFVPMAASLSDPNTFVGCLPAPAATAASLDYLFLSVNADKEVVKTAPAIKIEARKSEDAPSWQMGCGDDKLTVWKELPELPSPAGAYADSVAFDVVESGARFGAIAGLFGGQSGAAAVAVTTASNAGTVALTTAAGLSGQVLAVAALAVGAAAAGGGGGGSDNPSPPPTGTDGACGSAQGVQTETPPTSGLCSVGTPSSVVTGTSEFTWSCAPVGTGLTASCSAPRSLLVNGVCGSAASVPSLAPPSTNLCAAGTPSAVNTLDTTYSWSCGGLNGGTNASCTAPRDTLTVTTVYTADPGFESFCGISPSSASVYLNHYAGFQVFSQPGSGEAGIAAGTTCPYTIVSGSLYPSATTLTFVEAGPVTANCVIAIHCHGL